MTVPFRSPPQLRLRREAVCGGTSQPSSCVGGSWALSGTISPVSMLTFPQRSNRGSLATPPYPLQMRPRVRRRPRGGWAALRASVWPSCSPSDLPIARSAVQPSQNCPCPGLEWGQGAVYLSNQRLQLVFVQSGPEFPFDPFCHFLPGSPGGFHVLEDGQRLSQRSILPLNFATFPSPQSDGHVPAEVIGQWPGMYVLIQGPESGFETAGPIPVRALAGGATRRFLGCSWPPDLAASIAHLLLERWRFLF